MGTSFVRLLLIMSCFLSQLIVVEAVTQDPPTDAYEKHQGMLRNLQTLRQYLQLIKTGSLISSVNQIMYLEM